MSEEREKVVLNRTPRDWGRGKKPLKRLMNARRPLHTALKRGVNERCPRLGCPNVGRKMWAER
jgi:hypothetical protein